MSDFILGAPAPLNVHLSRLAVVEVAGKDAERFLQGQISAQVGHADDRFAPYGVFCTPKGRVIANVQLLRAEAERYWLITHTTLSETLRAHLAKYAVFFKTEIRQRDDIGLYGLAGEDKRINEWLEVATLPRRTGEVQRDDQRWLIRAPGEGRILALGTAPSGAEAATRAIESRWWLEEIRHGVAWLEASQSDAWLPQMINWEALGGISFKKGCYTGQEVVARAHYRGQVKKRLARLGVEGDATITVGDPVVDRESGKSVGTVVAVEPNEHGGSEMLAVVTLREAPIALSVGGAEAARLELPYAVERLDPETLVAAD
ncbi:YgfZ/GcvT domain-containing protein [Halotalea alkalilenta]|uniref:CAF17-like 4Fe-4S cluster assembly/insertion protein YgfZ n=1 Tax=Halotalea alkalilenta TaxID=376489 RepID=UPI0005BC326A|nr:folate-binding protein YgfZ [Halotalea alkalilenta]